MAYDLALRQSTPRNWSREESTTRAPLFDLHDVSYKGLEMLAVSGIGLVGLLIWCLPKARRIHERRYYRREYTKDDLRRTQEVPTITMRDMIYK